MDASTLRRLLPWVAALALAGCDADAGGDSFAPDIASGTSGASTGDGTDHAPAPPDDDSDGDGDDEPDDPDPSGADSSTGEPVVGTSSTGGEATSTTGDESTGGDSGEGSSESGEPVVDPCVNAMFGDGPYCGESLGGTAETLYVCAGGVTTGSIACDFGCAQCDPFVADVCMTMAGQSDADACS